MVKGLLQRLRILVRLSYQNAPESLKGFEKQKRRSLNKVIGNLGEEAAAAYLYRAGYRILCRNYRCTAGELDIIAEDRGILAFVEVKTRSPRSLLPPADAVDREKQFRIRKTSNYYLSQFRQPSPHRYDVVSVILDEYDTVVSIELAQAAFV